MSIPPSRSAPDEKLSELISAMQQMRDALINASLLLQEHPYETDHATREQARQATDALIRRSKSDRCLSGRLSADKRNDTTSHP